MRYLGWPLGWAFTVAAVSATGGTAGWTQSPLRHAAVGIALGAAGMFAGAWWSRGRRAAVAYLSHFIGVLAQRITGLQSADMAGLVLGAALAGGLCGAVASFIGDTDDPDG